jgi:hypothetical protein
VAHFRSAIREAEILANVNILFDLGIKERNVDVKLTEFEVHGGRNDDKEPEASHADNRGEVLSVVEARALTAALGDEMSFEARYGTLRIGLDLVYPNVVDTHTGEVSTVRRGLDTVLGGQHGNDVVRGTCRLFVGPVINVSISGCWKMSPWA